MNPDSHCRSFITPQIQYRSIIIDYLFRGFITCFANPLSLSHNHYFFAHSLFFRPLTISHAYSISFSRIYYRFREFTICFANPLSVSRIRYLFHEFTICFANPLSVSRIHYLFREFTIYIICFANPISVSRIHYLFRKSTICFFTFAIYDDSNQALRLLRNVMLT